MNKNRAMTKIIVAQKINRRENNCMNFVEKFLQKSLRKRMFNVLSEKNIAPFVIDLDPTSACQHRCTFCIDRKCLNNKEIPRNRLLPLIDELADMGVKGIVLIGGGEPLLHTHIAEIIEKISKSEIEIGLVTNGERLENFVDIVALNVKWTRVSLDAAYEETHTKIHRPIGGPCFERILQSMKYLATHSHRMGDVFWSFVITSQNLKEIYEAARRAKEEIKCNAFQLKPLMKFSHSLKPITGLKKELAKEQIKLIKENLVDDNFQLISSLSLDNYLSESDESISQPKNYVWCPSINLRTVITPTGLFACSYHRGLEKMCYGYLTDGLPFDEIWYGTKRKEICRSLNPKYDCRFFCARHNLNNFITGLVNFKEMTAIPIENYLVESKMNDVFI